MASPNAAMLLNACRVFRSSSSSVNLDAGTLGDSSSHGSTLSSAGLFTSQSLVVEVVLSEVIAKLKAGSKLYGEL